MTTKKIGVVPDWLAKVCKHFDWEIDEFTLNDDGVWSRDGESADGDPDVEIHTVDGDPAWVRWELGWYEQKGDVCREWGVIVLLDAFEAASTAMNSVLAREVTP